MITTVSGALLVSGAGTFAATFFETPTERIARLWREDPALGASLRPSLGIGATAHSIALWGRF